MLIIFFIFIPVSLSFTQEWNLTTSGIDLLSSTNEYDYIVYQHQKLIMKRIITGKNNEEIKVKNIIYKSNNEDEKKDVTLLFDNIQSSNYISTDLVICPYGNKHPYFYESLNPLIPNHIPDAQSIISWDLKCLWHSASLMLYISYFEKNKLTVSYTPYSKYKWDYMIFKHELLDFKLDNKTKDGNLVDISIISYYREDKKMLKLYEGKINIKTHEYEATNNYPIINIPVSNIKGYIKTNTSNFYFVAYNDTKVFYTGYVNTTINEDFLIVKKNLIFNNATSPFNLSDEVDIVKIDFIFRNKFIYYILKNKNENIYYHGIIDIELHKIIFNTKEIINKFIPYSDKAMLAITPDKAYIICAYKIDGNCTDYCPGGNYIINPNGNTCGHSCDDNQYRFISDNTCIDKCNESIYIIYKENDEKKCGTCKDFYKDKPYKFINGTNCYSSIPEGAIIKDNISNLMECDESYYFENETCYKKINCFHSCKECSEESTTEYDQKCTKCKDNYVFQNGNCLNNCSERYGIIDGECQECKDTSCDIFYINSCNCSKCKEHFYLIENNCLECDENCENCFSESNNCTSCNTSSFLFNGQCLSCTPCNEKEDNSCKCLSCSMGHFLQNGRCQKCSDNCQLCENITYCNSCEIGYALNINNNTCSRCHNNCESCSSPSINDTEQNCLSCNNNLFLYENNCVEECKDGLYTNEQNKICEKCNEHCKTCDEGGEPNDEHCSSCDINSTYKYLVNATGFPKNCVIECPNGTIENNEICVLKKQEPEPEQEQEQEPEQEKKKEKEQETQGNEKNEKNYSAVIISTSVVGGVIIIAAVILIVYFCHKRRKKNINFDEDENELMKNMGAEMEQL